MLQAASTIAELHTGLSPNNEMIRSTNCDEIEMIDKSNSETFILSPIGDLIIKLGPSSSDRRTYYFTVASQALRMASPDVWAKSLDPSSGFSGVKDKVLESGVRYKYLELEDDDPWALLTVFRIIHFRPKEVPIEVEFT